MSMTNSQSLPKLMSIELVIPSNHLVLCRPFLLLPSFFPSIRVFSNEMALCIRWPKFWSFHFSTSPSNEYSGLISFRINQFDLLAVPGTLKTPLACFPPKILDCYSRTERSGLKFNDKSKGLLCLKFFLRSIYVK